MDSVSFQLRQPRDQPGTLTGTLRMEEDAVVVQWMRETQFFPREQKVEEVRLPFPHLASAELRVPWFRRPRVVLQPRALDLAGRVPGLHEPGRIELWIARADLDAARALVSMINLRASEALLERATDPLGR